MEHKWWTLLVVCIGTFMLLLDITVVTVALPAIQVALHSTFSDLQWVLDAYALTLAAFMLIAGVLGDLFPRRGVYVVGLVVFTLSSLTCGLARSPLMLILSRGVQGLGAAMLFATGLALLALAFSGRERGIAFGIYGSVLGGAVAVGPLLGGAITSGISWRWIFFLNVPLGVIAVVLALTKVDEVRWIVKRRIDWIGFVSFGGSLFALVYALVRGNALGWASPTISGLLAGSALLMTIFVVTELRLGRAGRVQRHRHAARGQREPMLDISLFKRPAMSGVSIAAFALSASIFATFLYITLYLQEVLGYSAIGAGLRLLPMTVAAFVVAPLAGRLSLVVRSRYLLGLGLLLVALACELMTRVHTDSSGNVLLPGFIVAGVGIGMANPIIASATISVVPPEQSGMASGISSTFRQVGLATGIAALGAVFLAQIQSATVVALRGNTAGRAVLHLGTRVSVAISQGMVRETAASLPTNSARQALLSAYRTGFTSTFDHLMALASVVAAIGGVAALALVRQRDFVPSISLDEALVAPAPEGADVAASTPAPVDRVSPTSAPAAHSSQVG
jgi:EmrB/QacA subfamily drug resistance transporter